MGALHRAGRKALVLQGGGALGCLPGRRVRGAEPAEGPATALGGRRLDRRHQRGADRRQRPGKRVERLREFWELVSSGPSQRLPELDGRPRHAEPVERQPALPCSAFPASSSRAFRRRLLHGRRGAAAELLRHRAAEADARTPGRLRPHQRARGAPERRRGQRAQRQLDLLRQHACRRSGPSTSWPAARCRPGFAPVEVDGEPYWDGGIVSNTPLQYVLDNHPRSEPLVVLAGRPVQRARRDADDHVRGARAAEGHHLFEPHPHEHRCAGRQREPAAGHRRPDRQAAGRAAQRRRACRRCVRS